MIITTYYINSNKNDSNSNLYPTQSLKLNGEIRTVYLNL